MRKTQGILAFTWLILAVLFTLAGDEIKTATAFIVSQIWLVAASSRMEK